MTNALGQRVSEFETVTIGYTPTGMTTNIWYIPTNLPTRNLDIHFNADIYRNTNYTCRIYMPTNWHPMRPTVVRIFAGTTDSRTFVAYGIGERQVQRHQLGASQRIAVWQWIPEHVETGLGGIWRFWTHQLAMMPQFILDSTGENRWVSANLPESIEEWIEWRKQQPW